MIEKLYSYTKTDEKTIEKIVDDENAAINHMVLNKGEALPLHDANSHVYMIVARGTLSITLADQDTHVYESGSILNIPYGTRMYVRNEADPVLELFVVKAPNPRAFLGK
ncbi:MAG TPA: cupin domain-containing protein [Bacillota bacterium]|nr:cupin domain-containing protein [Bacillota bacterium]HOA14791.1 cupin domain-containing protein [Bacillota bacterium]HOG52562.1 cupin domain-containing protein [Bacillota bacterium]